jgi:membrane-associated phospholipid phosphatase
MYQRVCPESTGGKRLGVLMDRERDATQRALESPSELRPTRHAYQPRAAISTFVLAYCGLTAVLLAVGILLTHTLDGTVGRWDLDVNRWFVTQRTDSWNAVSGSITFMLDTVPVICVALVAVTLFVIRHHVAEALAIVVGLTLEITVFLSVTFVVARPRPDVPRLSSTPTTSSFPSGHTAAAVVLYGGIALGVYWCTRSSLVRNLVWGGALFAVASTGLSRTYRGMHHPTDVFVGALFGLACLLLAQRAVHTYLGANAPARPAEDKRAAPRPMKPVEAEALR